MLELVRYIVLNPVRANLVSHAREWKWSSYLATSGELAPPPWLAVCWIQELFKSSHGTPLLKYQQFINEGLAADPPWKKLKKQIYLGSNYFINEISKNTELVQVSKLDSEALIESLIKTQNRNLAILKAYETGMFTLGDLARYFNLHYSRISKIIKQESERQKASA